jgi:hypothetical protein
MPSHSVAELVLGLLGELRGRLSSWLRALDGLVGAT